MGYGVFRRYPSRVYYKRRIIPFGRAADNDITASASLSFGGSATLNATGSLSATGNITFGSSATLSGTGSLTATGSIVFGSSASLTAPDGLSATGTISFGGSATLSAVGSLTASTNLAFSGSATLGSGLVEETVTCTLVTINGVSRPNLSSLSWAWFDQTDPNSFAAPTDQGEVESTDGAGQIIVDLTSTSLTTGQQGTLVLRSDDGSLLGAYNLSID